MAEEKPVYSRSIYFKLPNYRILMNGNTYTGSENTFNYRLKLDKDADRLRLWVWYGMTCFEKSDIAGERDAENSETGLSGLAAAVDEEYDIYKEKLKKGEIKSRPTYIGGDGRTTALSDYYLFGEGANNGDNKK